MPTIDTDSTVSMTRDDRELPRTMRKAATPPSEITTAAAADGATIAAWCGSSLTTRAYDRGRGLADSISGGRQRTAYRTITLQLVPSVPLLRRRFGNAEREFVFWERLTYLDGEPNATWSSYLPGQLATPLLTHPRRDRLGLDQAFAELPRVHPDRTGRVVHARLVDPCTAVLLDASSPTAPCCISSGRSTPTTAA